MGFVPLSEYRSAAGNYKMVMHQHRPWTPRQTFSMSEIMIIGQKTLRSLGGCPFRLCPALPCMEINEQHFQDISSLGDSHYLQLNLAHPQLSSQRLGKAESRVTGKQKTPTGSSLLQLLAPRSGLCERRQQVAVAADYNIMFTCQ